MDNFSPEYLDKLPKEIVLKRKTRTSQQGDMEYLHIGFKVMHQSKA